MCGCLVCAAALSPSEILRGSLLSQCADEQTACSVPAMVSALCFCCPSCLLVFNHMR